MLFIYTDYGSIKNHQLSIDDSITPLLHNDALKYLVFENIIENGAFAQKEQMLHFPYFQHLTSIFLEFFNGV